MRVAGAMVGGKEVLRNPYFEAGNPLWNHYKCGDDKWVALAHLSPDKFWPLLCKAMGLEALKKGPSVQHDGQQNEELPEADLHS